MKLVHVKVLLVLAAAWTASAQSWDSSGNGMLKGTYYFREVAYELSDYYGDMDYALAFYGAITFDGNGNYTISGNAVDSQSGVQQTITPGTKGTYVISASGYGYLSSLASSGNKIYGLVSKSGVFVGSATEGYTDLLIAAPLASPVPTVSSFKGPYTVADMDFPAVGYTQQTALYSISSTFQWSPDGAGNLGSFVATGYVGQATTPTTQTVGAARYLFQNGAAVLTLPATQNATLGIAGQKYVYFSPDGNFIFGGSPLGFDMFVGVRPGSGTPTFSGLYYQAGIDQITGLSFDTYYGSLSALGGGQLVQHERQLYAGADGSYGPYGYTFADTFTAGNNGQSATTAMKYTVSADGTIRIGSGIGPYLGINVALAAPDATAGSGVYIYPQYVLNAVSYTPFTAGVSPGELVTLAGQNLADTPQTASTLPLPKTLGNVQVKVNGLEAPIYSVSSGLISFLVPYQVSSATLASIQVVKGSSSSNTVTLPVNATTPGVFTFQQNGVGDASALHADYSFVNSANPAQPGETIQVFVTGLGTVTPLVADGAAAPSDSLVNTTNTFTAFINGEQATVEFAGLAPGQAALYQMNITLPTDLKAGKYALDLSGSDSYASEATVQVGSASASAQFEPAIHRRAPMRLGPTAQHAR
jgi:uncharacterized protein (TIGR03437 family)